MINETNECDRSAGYLRPGRHSLSKTSVKWLNDEELGLNKTQCLEVRLPVVRIVENLFHAR